ncbi:hypothetical protein [Lactobacillus sp. ESL0228]|uniref:hypothetical protein n=1 Tax=Lactobacillus sp. ESL0228 TaxID=2069352 RepID=UPI000EFAB5B0|nr:hypothetical protein [Lactobacillus sp. ESL0228]RMC51797.1 hypothetical protein F5ESL0228_00650 [Lactobacillus sp. ESL0228]
MYLNREKGHDFLKLVKMKSLTVINGLLTLSSLIMLFFGLCNQVNESDYLLNDEQLIARTGTDNLIVVIAIIALIFFGFAFFASWLNSSKVRIMRYKA